MPHPELVVRAIDVGYGHIKFSDGRDGSKLIRTDSIPSQSPAARTSSIAVAGPMQRRDTFVIPVGDASFEVGRDVRHALESNHESEVLGADFALSTAYAARLYGALNYMLPGLPSNEIDVLVLGLPLNTFSKLHSSLAEKFSGEHVINARGNMVRINTCHVYPQPLGSYTAYISTLNEKSSRPPKALIVDPGYNTVDWFVCQGMVANDNRSKAVQRGMGAVLRAIADRLIASMQDVAPTPAELIRMLDESLTTGSDFRICGEVFGLEPFIGAGNAIIDEAAQSLFNNVGAGIDIDVIVLTGGGALWYRDAIAAKYPRHRVVTLDAPALANVRGFHMLGELLARSRQRATQSPEAVPA